MTDQELKELVASLAEEHKKTEAALASLAKEHEKTEVAQQKTEAALVDLKQTVKETTRQLGDMGNIRGEIAEDLFRRNLSGLMKARGITLDKVEHRLKVAEGHEYDLVGINGEVIVLIEVKNKLKEKDIEAFVSHQISFFRDDFPKYKSHKIIGGVGSFVISRELEKRAMSLGLLVLTQKGEDGADIINSADFKPKLY